MSGHVMHPVDLPPALIEYPTTFLCSCHEIWKP